MTKIKLVPPDSNIPYDIRTGPQNHNFDQGFPIHELLDMIELNKRITKMIIDNIKIYIDVCGLESDKSNISNNAKIRQILNDLNYGAFSRYITYTFPQYVSYLFVDSIYKSQILHEDDKVLIITRNRPSVDAIIYYAKYINYNYKKDMIDIFLYRYDRSIDKSELANMITYNKFKLYEYSEPLTNPNIKNIVAKIANSYNMITIDLNIVIEQIHHLTGNYAFQTILSLIIISLHKLKQYGNLMLYVPIVRTQAIMDFYSLLSSMFGKCYFYMSDTLHIGVYYTVLVCKKFKGASDLDAMYKLNNAYYECDPSGGLNYQIANDTETLILKNNYKSPNPPKCYVTQIVKHHETTKVFDSYCEIAKGRIIARVRMLNEIVAANNDNIKLTKLLSENLMYTLSYLKNIGMSFVEWIPTKSFDNFFFETMVQHIKFNIRAYKHKFKYMPSNIIIQNHDTIKGPPSKEYEYSIWKMSESVYEYIDTTEKRQYESVNLFFNNKQKNVQKFLFAKFKININNQYVSRAWCKMIELVDATKYYDNIESDSINVFHICEAPGNFIKAMEYYTQTYTKIKNYKYVAQSLVNSDINDEYGFMKSNPDKWDFGTDKTGDIMAYDNLVYYYDRYKGVDSLVGDCGMPWTPESKSKRSISTYQLIYALLFPKTGGNFIIKSYSPNFNVHFLSLLSVIASKYTKLYIIRSSINFWSPEIYIVGIGKKELIPSEITNIFNIAKGLENDKLIYPVDILNTDFIKEYEYNIYNLVNLFMSTKKFFVYLARNPKVFNNNKYILETNIDQINKHWLTKFIKLDQNISGEYDKFIKGSHKQKN